MHDSHRQYVAVKCKCNCTRIHYLCWLQHAGCNLCSATELTVMMHPLSFFLFLESNSVLAAHVCNKRFETVKRTEFHLRSSAHELWAEDTEVKHRTAYVA